MGRLSFRGLAIWGVMGLGALAENAGAAWKVSLAEAEQWALESSSTLGAAAAEFRSAEEAASAQYALFFPRFSLDATAKYVSQVPELNGRPYGSHRSYSMGPTLSYTLIDLGATRYAYQSASLFAGARKELLNQSRETTLTLLRRIYVRLQLVQNELELVSESLSLAQKQFRDIQTRLSAGAASHLDESTAHREVLAYQLRLSQARSDVEGAVLDLWAMIKRPIQLIEVIQNPGELYQLDPIDRSIADVDFPKWLKRTVPYDHHPGLQAQRLIAESTQKAADAQASAYWPVVQVQARASYDYPNGPVIDRIQQNSVSANLSWSLFDWGRTQSLVAQRRADAEAASMRQDQVRVDLERDWVKVLGEVQFLNEQRQIAKEAIAESERVAKLNDESYRAGRINFTEVQNANLRLLESRVQWTRVGAQLLNQIVNLKALSGEDIHHD